MFKQYILETRRKTENSAKKEIFRVLEQHNCMDLVEEVQCDSEMFGGYLLIKANQSQNLSKLFYNIKGLKFVTSKINNIYIPNIISEYEVNEIKSRSLILLDEPDLKINDRVFIIDGIFKNIDGVVKKTNDIMSEIELTQYGKLISAEIKNEYIQKKTNQNI